jgi:hypothetical protein
MAKIKQILYLNIVDIIYQYSIFKNTNLIILNISDKKIGT